MKDKMITIKELLGELGWSTYRFAIESKLKTERTAYNIASETCSESLVLMTKNWLEEKIDMRLLWTNKALEMIEEMKEKNLENDLLSIHRLDVLVKQIKGAVK